MFTASRLRRSAILGALSCALLAATTGAAPAQPNDEAHCRVQLGAGLPFVPCPHRADPVQKSTLTRSDDSQRLTAAQAHERYYSSYGEPDPITAPVAPAPTNHTPWLTIALAAVALASASIAAIHRRRLRLRSHVARATT